MKIASIDTMSDIKQLLKSYKKTSITIIALLVGLFFYSPQHKTISYIQDCAPSEEDGCIKNYEIKSKTGYVITDKKFRVDSHLNGHLLDKCKPIFRGPPGGIPRGKTDLYKWCQKQRARCNDKIKSHWSLNNVEKAVLRVSILGGNSGKECQAKIVIEYGEKLDLTLDRWINYLLRLIGFIP